MKKVLVFLKKNVVLEIAAAAAIITAFIVPPDGEYLEYFDWSTLACLFGTLLVVEALSNIRFFEILARKIVVKFKNMRNITFALVFVTYFGSMIMANDMALITFLPLGQFVLSQSGKKEYTAYVFILQNVAANLGGMLTPFGNPQNLFVYSYYKIPTWEFFRIMLPPFLIALALIVFCCALVKKEEAVAIDDEETPLDKKKTAIYLALFILSVCSVLRIFPFYVGIGIATLGVAAFDRKAFKTVNYSLLLTFCAFFVFSGNMSRIDAVSELIGGLLNKNVLLVSALSCQVISNVPSATLLCRFTENYAPLLVGVNVGGLGTPIASLASLITLGKYRESGGDAWKYLAKFSLVNFAFLAILLVFEKFRRAVYPPDVVKFKISERLSKSAFPL